MRTIGAHLFGYVGAITEDEYARARTQGYSPNDVVGKDGLEQHYDHWLRGKVGGQQIEVNASGELVRRLKPVDPVPGNTLITTIDARLQRIVDKDLRARARAAGASCAGIASPGAVVVLDPYTGGVLAMASYPAYNPNDFATPISARKFAHYLNDPLQPLYNRAIGAASPTGSTFKMVTGSGAISSRGDQARSGALRFGRLELPRRRCSATSPRAGSGTTDFVKALAASSDGYFYQVGDRLGHQRLRYYALQYGLGARLGIDLPASTPAIGRPRSGSRSHLRQGLPPRAERRLPAGDRAGRDAGHAAADRRRDGDGPQRRDALPAAHRRRRSAARTARSSRRSTHEVIRHVNVTAESLREVKAGMDQVTEPWGTGLRAGHPRAALRRQDRDRRDRRRRIGRQHDLVRRLRPGRRTPSSRWPSTWRRPAATAPASRPRSRSTSWPTTFDKKIDRRWPL